MPNWEIYFWDPRAGGEPRNISKNAYQDSKLQINAQGQVVWETQNESKMEFELYYWDARVGGVPKKIASSPFAMGFYQCAQMNAKGQLLYTTFSWYSPGVPYGLYYWDASIGGTEEKIDTSNDTFNEIKIQ